MSKFKAFFPAIAGGIILLGLIFRLYHISDNQFLFYDEGLYIGYNRVFLNLVANNPAHSLSEWGVILSLIFKTALAMPKALWFFILSMRVFFLGPEAWFFARWVSAASGIATVILLYFWAGRYFNSRRIGMLSALILLILPSHVFYSRLGMQESLSALLFLSAIYCYTLQERLSWSFYLSAFLLDCVYFTNYRMIIGPIFIAFIECFKAVTERRALDWAKIFIYGAVFFGIVLAVGCLYGGVNLHVTTAWMFHQAEDAGGKFNPINFLSYPYYVFALEGFFFACFFWGNLYLLKLKEYSKLLPFGIVVLQMGIFSFAAEKGARYLCVVLPFMAAAAAVLLDDCWQRYSRKYERWILAAAGLALAGMIYLSCAITFARTDYESAIQLIIDHDPQASIISTQPLVEGLYLTDDKKIVACPTDINSLFVLYQHGAKYLVLDPQAYISWTVDGRRFSPPLDNFLQTTLEGVQPIATLPHLNGILLNRFVLDHNEQIMDSLKFLSQAHTQEYGKIRIYDLGSVLAAVARAHAQGLY